jgi:SAM-dependent methyltransferase
MEEAECAVCGKSSAAPYIATDVGGERFTYLRCSGCGLVFLNPRPDSGEILKYYAGDYYGEGDRKFRAWLEMPRLYFAGRRVKRLRRFLPPQGRALDIGCGQGTFLKLLAQAGWQVQGTELSADSARRAGHAGIPVSVGEIRERQFAESSLDLVTLWHVIEHLCDPGSVLRRLRPMLGKNAVIAISTPNIESLQARIFLGKWFHLDPPRHLYLFSPKALTDLFAREGFRRIHISHISLEQNPYGWIQSSLNSMPFAKGDLYSFLKKSTRPPGSRARFHLELGKVLALATGLFPACLVLSFIMGWQHQGGTIEAYFKKEN